MSDVFEFMANIRWSLKCQDTNLEVAFSIVKKTDKLENDKELIV